MKYLLQTSYSYGTYRNPYKRGGSVLRYSPWKTVQRLDTLEQAKQAWSGMKQDGLVRRRVQLSGKTVITDTGMVLPPE